MARHCRDLPQVQESLWNSVDGRGTRPCAAGLVAALMSDGYLPKRSAHVTDKDSEETRLTTLVEGFGGLVAGGPGTTKSTSKQVLFKISASGPSQPHLAVLLRVGLTRMEPILEHVGMGPILYVRPT